METIEQLKSELLAARAEVEALKTLWTEMRVVLAQSRDANCLCSYGATQVDAVQAANKMLNVMPKDVQSELASLRAQLATAKEERDAALRGVETLRQNSEAMKRALKIHPKSVTSHIAKLEADLAKANAAVEEAKREWHKAMEWKDEAIREAGIAKTAHQVCSERLGLKEITHRYEKEELEAKLAAANTTIADERGQYETQLSALRAQLAAQQKGEQP